MDLEEEERTNPATPFGELCQRRGRGHQVTPHSSLSLTHIFSSDTLLTNKDFEVIVRAHVVQKKKEKSMNEMKIKARETNEDH